MRSLTAEQELIVNTARRFVDKEVMPAASELEHPLVFSLAVGMSVRDTSGQTIANLGYELVTFEQPLFVGDSPYAESEVLDKRESGSKPDRKFLAPKR